MPAPPAPDWSRCALAVDIGGTKLAAGVIGDLGQVMASRRVPTPVAGDAAELFDALCAVIDSVLHASGLDPGQAQVFPALGVATAAPLDREAGTVSPVNIAGWRDFPLRDRLADRYHLDVRMLGDAVAVAVGEHWRGAARGRRNVLGWWSRPGWAGE